MTLIDYYMAGYEQASKGGSPDAIVFKTYMSDRQEKEYMRGYQDCQNESHSEYIEVSRELHESIGKWSTT